MAAPVHLAEVLWSSWEPRSSRVLLVPDTLYFTGGRPLRLQSKLLDQQGVNPRSQLQGNYGNRVGPPQRPPRTSLLQRTPVR